jgi:fluoroacetyl-CoA thioesterase
MKDTFKEGMTRKKTILVDKDRTIGFLGEDLRVYATPNLIGDIERTCLEFIKEHADDNEHSVGTHVEVTHSAGSPLGMSVDITVTVKEIDRRKITFDVVAHDGIDECCTGTHSRFVVDVDKLKERVSAKVAKAKALKG